MNSSKFLHELMMKNKPNLKFNKKYFLAIFTALGIQISFGVSSAYATECYNEMLQVCKLEPSGPQCYVSEDAMEKAEFNKEKVLQDDINWYDEQVDFYRERHNRVNTVNTKFNLCLIKERRKRWLAYSSSNQASNSGTSSTQSSSNSSSQSNKKANQQSTNRQSNKNTSNKPQPDPIGEMGNVLGGVAGNQTSSNSNDLSKMTGNQLIDVAIDAESRGDYAQAYLAELQLSKDPNPKLSRQGLRQVSFRLRTGKGVAINRTESHRLAVQAANLGDVTAHSYVCADYLNGKGVEENHIKAFDYCLFAAEKGDMKAQNNLAWLYRHGNGIEQNQRLSDEWTCKAVAQGEEASIGNAEKLNLNCN